MLELVEPAKHCHISEAKCTREIEHARALCDERRREFGRDLRGRRERNKGSVLPRLGGVGLWAHHECVAEPLSCWIPGREKICEASPRRAIRVRRRHFEALCVCEEAEELKARIPTYTHDRNAGHCKPIIWNRGANKALSLGDARFNHETRSFCAGDAFRLRGFVRVDG